MISEFLNQVPLFFSMFSGIFEGFYIVMKCIVKNPFLLFLLVLGILSATIKHKHKF
jgi:hypothetical protein